MSIKSKLLAGSAALSVVAGIVGAGLAGGVNAATPSCGADCRAYYTQGLGQRNVIAVYKRVSSVGQKLILWPASNSDPAQDFTYARQGTVNMFYRLGLVSAGLKLHYGRRSAFELQYSPYGVTSGLCVGVGWRAGNETPVTLQTCGESSKTVWVMDSRDASGGYEPLINGSNTNFSNPYVLTNENGTLRTYRLQRFSDGTVFDNQMWAYLLGVL